MVTADNKGTGLKAFQMESYVEDTVLECCDGLGQNKPRYFGI